MTMICTYTDTSLTIRAATDATCSECACRSSGIPAPGHMIMGQCWVCWQCGLYTCDEAPACPHFIRGTIL